MKINGLCCLEKDIGFGEVELACTVSAGTGARESVGLHVMAACLTKKLHYVTGVQVLSHDPLREKNAATLPTLTGNALQTGKKAEGSWCP